jgi:hypothetical protein
MSRSFKDSLRSRVGSRVATKKYIYLSNYVTISMFHSFKHSLRSRVATKKYIYLSNYVTISMSRSFKDSLHA